MDSQNLISSRALALSSLRNLDIAFRHHTRRPHDAYDGCSLMLPAHLVVLFGGLHQSSSSCLFSAAPVTVEVPSIHLDTKVYSALTLELHAFFLDFTGVSFFVILLVFGLASSSSFFA